MKNASKFWGGIVVGAAVGVAAAMIAVMMIPSPWDSLWENFAVVIFAFMLAAPIIAAGIGLLLRSERFPRARAYRASEDTAQERRDARGREALPSEETSAPPTTGRSTSGRDSWLPPDARQTDQLPPER